MTLRTAILLFLMVFCAVHTAHTQNTYHSTWYSADTNHLPQNSVKSIVADKYGYIWLSTEGGVVRYDGRDFKLYNSENLPGVTSDRMFMFGGDISQDSIIVRTESKQMLLIKGRRIQVLDIPPLKDTKQRRYTYMEVLHPYHFSLPLEVFRMTADDGYFIIDKNEIKKYGRDKNLLSYKNHSYPDSTQFFTVGKNLYRLLKNEGYSRVDVKIDTKGKFTMPLHKNHKILSNMPHRQVFLLNGRQLFYITGNAGKLQTHLVYENFDPGINIHSLYYDADSDVLYLGSSNKGLLIVRKHKFKYMTSPLKHNTGTNGVYYAINKFQRNKILSATGDIFEDGKHIGKINFENNSDKYGVIIDSKEDIWVKTSDEISRYKKATNYTTFDSWEFDGRISFITEGTDGRIWIGKGENEIGYNGALFVINPYIPGDTPKLFLNLPYTPICISWINNKEFYAGSLAGLYKINSQSGKSVKVEEFPDVYVRSIAISKPNEVWIGTYDSGMYLLSGKKATHFPMDRNKYMLNTHCIIEDGIGFLWLTTNRGIFQIKKQDLLNYADGKNSKLYYYHHNKSAGFLNNEFNGGCYPCGILDNGQTMYLPSMDGIVYFNPDKVKPDIPNNNIYIDDIEVDGKNYFVSDTLKLNRNFGRIKIYVSSPFSGDPYNQIFEVKLDGPVSQQWLPLADSHIAFTTLPPGYYTVTVRKLAGFGGAKMYKTISFTVVPAVWQQTWFLLVSILVALIILYFSVKLRIRYIRYKNILLEKKIVEQTLQLRNTVSALRKTQHDLNNQITIHKKLIRIITHDIKSPLKFMAITGKYLYKKLGSNSGHEDELLAIHSSSAQLYEFVDNFLEYAKESESKNSDPYSLHELAQEKITLFKNLATSRKITFVNLVSPYLDVAVNRHLLSIILHNLTDNAVKHTFIGTITFTATTENNFLKLVIADSGEGMDISKLKHYRDMFNNIEPTENIEGMGLTIIIELMHILNGTLDIDSEPGKGTTVSLLFTL